MYPVIGLPPSSNGGCQLTIAEPSEGSALTAVGCRGAVMGATAGVRRLGAAALDLAYVAAGRYDGFWEFGLSPWDLAAGILLIREAGGYVSDLAGGHDMLNSGTIVAANDHLHLPLAALVKDAMRRHAAPG